MQKIKSIINFIVGHIIVLILILSAIAFIHPQGFTWMTKYTAVFLGIAMFGMGTTIEPDNLKNIIIHPKEICVGLFAQFIIMPFTAWVLCMIFNLPKEIALGVILVGCCPGGTASNVITHIANGDVTLSVTMTTISTLISPFITPVLVYFLAGAWVEVSLMAMFLTVLKIILLPVLLGILANKLLGRKMEYISPFLPLVSSISIVMIISGIIAINADKIIESGLIVTVVVFAHNITGFLLGLGFAKICKIDYKKSTAIAIEVGMQNSGLAVSLAMVNFANNPLATLPGAIFSVVHNLTGSVFANIRRTKTEKIEKFNNQELQF